MLRKKITEQTTLEVILEKPQAQDILAKHRVPCLTCPMAQYELKELKIGEVAKMYGLDIKKILADLNK